MANKSKPIETHEEFIKRLHYDWLKEIANTGSGKLEYETILGFEDFLNDYSVFISGFGAAKEKRSLLAYGTCIDYEQFVTALKEIGKDRLNTSQWQQVIDYFMGFHYLSPIAGLVAAEISRFAGLKNPLDNK